MSLCRHVQVQACPGAGVSRRRSVQAQVSVGFTGLQGLALLFSQFTQRESPSEKQTHTNHALDRLSSQPETKMMIYKDFHFSWTRPPVLSLTFLPRGVCPLGETSGPKA